METQLAKLGPLRCSEATYSSSLFLLFFFRLGCGFETLPFPLGSLEGNLDIKEEKVDVPFLHCPTGPRAPSVVLPPIASLSLSQGRGN